MTLSLQDKKIYIIGQGIAGSVLAFLLDKKGYDVSIIDDGHKSSSGMVAAGMWNPVSFKRMSQSWMVDDLLPVADNIYRSMEVELNTSFYHPMELVKIFSDNKTANSWDEHSASAKLSHYLTAAQDEEVKQQFRQPYGHGILKNSGWLDIPTLLAAAKVFFQAKGKLRITSITKQDIDRILAEDLNAIIILATGTQSTELFSEKVKVIPNKGEVLTIESDKIKLNRLMNFGKFLIPLGNGKFRVGSTYDWTIQDNIPTEKGKENILKTFYNHYPNEVKVTEHVAGYRPTTRDRRPIIGFHPENTQLGFFNGFGSKGVMLVPYFSQHFTDYLENGTPLLKEVNVLRYFE